MKLRKKDRSVLAELSAGGFVTVGARAVILVDEHGRRLRLVPQRQIKRLIAANLVHDATGRLTELGRDLLASPTRRITAPETVTIAAIPPMDVLAATAAAS